MPDQALHESERKVTESSPHGEIILKYKALGMI
jgi:hypothetical protein